MLLMPDLLGYWLTGARGRGDERVDDGAVRPRTRGLGDRTSSRRSALPARILRADPRAGDALGPILDDGAADDRAPGDTPS